MRLWREGDIIHAEAAHGDDVTLCGYALEGECNDGGEDECFEVFRKRITCQACVGVILFCKAIPARSYVRETP